MKNTLIIIVLTLIIGVFGGAFINKKLAKKGTNDIAKFEEIIKVKELHLIKHRYQDLSFIHKKNDQNKTLRAIAIVPVVVSAYIDLSEIEIQKKNDSIMGIVLPEPKLNDPNYQIDKMEVKQVRNFQIHVGKDLYAEVLKYLKDITIRRKEALIKLSIDNGILDETKDEASIYLSSLMKGLGLNEVPIKFKSKNTEMDTVKLELEGYNKLNNKLFSLSDMDENLVYNPELIPALHVDD